MTVLYMYIPESFAASLLTEFSISGISFKYSWAQFDEFWFAAILNVEEVVGSDVAVDMLFLSWRLFWIVKFDCWNSSVHCLSLKIFI